MAGLMGGKPKTPKPPPPVPQIDDSQIVAAAEAERLRRQNAGRASTSLVDQTSITAPAVSAAKLLGA